MMRNRVSNYHYHCSLVPWESVKVCLEVTSGFTLIYLGFWVCLSSYLSSCGHLFHLLVNNCLDMFLASSSLSSLSLIEHLLCARDHAACWTWVILFKPPKGCCEINIMIPILPLRKLRLSLCLQSKITYLVSCSHCLTS